MARVDSAIARMKFAFEIGYPFYNVDDIKAVVKALEAAREFIEFARYYEEPHWHEYGRLLQNYDEATK